MNTKKMLPLFVLVPVVVVLGVALGVLNHADTEEEDTSIALCSLDADSVTAIAYKDASDGATLESALTKTDDTWSCSTDPMAQIDADKMKTMLSSLGSMTADSKVENATDLSQYGLDASTQKATIQFSDGSEKTLTFGMENEIVGGIYVQVSGDDNVYLVGSSYVNTTLNKGVDDLKVDDTDDADDTSSDTSATTE